MLTVKVLAQRVAREQHVGMANLENMSDRAWFALHCLPRGPKGRPPSLRSLEDDNEIARATFTNLFSGARKDLRGETLRRVSQALHVSTGWLANGEGEPPKLTGPLKPREEQYGEFDPATWAAKAEAAGGVEALASPRNNFEAAVQTLVKEVSAAAIAKIAEEAKSHENDRPAHHWGFRLRDEERAIQVANAKPPAKKKQPKRKSDAPIALKRHAG